MVPFQHIFVATDFGPSSANALDVALTMANEFGSRVTVFHAYTLPTMAYAYAQGIAFPMEELEEAAKKELDATVAKAKERHANVEGRLVLGDPANSVLEGAAQRHADLIVLGTHGRRGLARALLGSVAEKVVRLSPIPVMTVSVKDEPRAKS